MNKLLMQYIRFALVESHKETELELQEVEEQGEKDQEEVNEFSGAGAVAGFTAPLGAIKDTPAKRKKRATWK